MPFDAMPDDEYEYMLTLSPEERAQYLSGKREAAQPAPRQQPAQRQQPAPAGEDAPEAPQRAIRRPFNMQAYSQSLPMQNDFIAQFGPMAQARSLGGMVSDVQDAYQDENDSRVAQMREQRRMAHERDMESMRQEELLQRLSMEQREREKDRILQKQLTSGVTTRQFIDGRWVDV
jgi:hypothetical protein